MVKPYRGAPGGKHHPKQLHWRPSVVSAAGYHGGCRDGGGTPALQWGRARREGRGQPEALASLILGCQCLTLAYFQFSHGVARKFQSSLDIILSPDGSPPGRAGQVVRHMTCWGWRNLAALICQV